MRIAAQLRLVRRTLPGGSSDRSCSSSGQYTLHRTPAQSFFPERVYKQVEDALLKFGQEQLGCRALSPIWLSYYVDGCR